MTRTHLPGTFAEHAAEDCFDPGCDQWPGAVLVHPLAVAEFGASLGAGTRVWRWSLIRDSVAVGPGCIIGSHVVLGPHVQVGAGCKIEDGAKIYGPCILSDEVFVGPNSVVCNDRYPRAAERGWHPTHGTTLIEQGASLGAGSVVLPGIRIGAGAMLGAGAVATRNIPPGQTWSGSPARQIRRR